MLPKAIVLQTSDGEHVGFVLLAIPDGSSSGECVFMITPQNPALFDAPGIQPLFQRKALGESKVDVASSNPLRLIVQSTNHPHLIIEFTDATTGTWREESPGTSSGAAVLARSA